MNDHDSSPTDARVPARVTELETLFTHLQRLLKELNEVVVAQGQRLDELELRAQRLHRQVEAHADQLYEPPDPREDKPPHY